MLSMSEKSTQRSNVPEFSVSELAFSLKRTLEDNYARVRVRGELSRISIPKSGHMYSNLKDDKSVIDAVCWKGVLSKLSIKPEEGMEVICVGRITTYPARSNYQLIIESMELAGEGALLKMLEERKKKLAAEGLFAPDRKRPLPFLPQKIGVITSPTGAVIRDILHRLGDRFPRHVVVWPVKVQGKGADQEITAAIDGFNALPIEGRPDILIVARGGGSLEDLMPFNEENVVRATANSAIPIISAIGHETDTTLIDYAADLRAPTPTGAAEMAVPVRLNLIAQVADDEKRLINGISRLLSENRHRLDALSAKLGDPARLMELKTQHLDHTTSRLDHNFKHLIMQKTSRVIQISSMLVTPKARIDTAHTSLTRWSEQLEQSTKRAIENKTRMLNQTQEKLEILSFENVLKRGYVVIRDDNDQPITQGKALSQGQNINLQFQNSEKIGAIINMEQSAKTPIAIKTSSPAKPTETKLDQGSLF
ncbi:MAG: exodeoxyribonuclease VII large subunit [Alphaproteobacteria bacterium]|nr:MAG: exodeoxyribonuclease VII large subunit [Alphaproteobacteria bacterium]